MLSLSRNLPSLRQCLASIPVTSPDVTWCRHVSTSFRLRKRTLGEEFHIDELAASAYMDQVNYFPSKPRPSRRTHDRKRKGNPRRHGYPDLAEKMEAFMEASMPPATEPRRATYAFRATNSLEELFQDVPQSVKKRRLTTLRRVQRVLDDNFRGHSYKVEVFGSTRNGLSSSESDLDIIVLDPQHPHGYVPEDGRRPPGIYNARRLGNLFYKAGFTEVEPIPWAATPIVKFRDPVTSLQCDLNVNERLGIFNSDLISAYCDILPTLRPLLHAVKSWAKSRDLNTPSPPGKHPRSFSSYALVIMTLGFLQVRGYLPNLQDFSRNQEVSRFDYWLSRPRSLRCDCRFFLEPPPGWKPPNIPQDELLMDWFRFWGSEFNYNEHTLSISKGGIVGRKPPLARPENHVDPGKKKKRPLRFRGNPPLCVIDPFIPTKNLAVSVTRQVIARFAEECGAMVNQSD